MDKIIEGFSEYSINKSGTVKRIKDGYIMKIKYGSGQPSLSLRADNGEFYKKRVAWLVAEAFIPNPNNYNYVWHLDRNYNNNKVSNLIWAERAQDNYPIGFYEWCVENCKGIHIAELAKLASKRFKTRISYEILKGYLSRHKICNGIDMTFRCEGKVNRCKPKKGVRNSPNTEFKKGQLPFNTQEVGTEIIDANGYIKVKISDRRDRPSRFNWAFKHVLIWEEAYGPIPEGHMLTFLDGNKQNVNLENLALISLAENAILNKGKLRSNDPEFTKVGIMIAKVNVKASKILKKCANKETNKND